MQSATKVPAWATNVPDATQVEWRRIGADQIVASIDVGRLPVRSLPDRPSNWSTDNPVMRTLSPDGRLLALACCGRAGIFDTRDLRLLQSFAITCDFPGHIAFDPTSTQLLVQWDDWIGAGEQGPDLGFAVFKVDVSSGASPVSEVDDRASRHIDAMSESLMHESWTEEELRCFFEPLKPRLFDVLYRAQQKRACKMHATAYYSDYSFPTFNPDEQVWNSLGTKVIALDSQTKSNDATALVVTIASGHAVKLCGHRGQVKSAGFFPDREEVYTYSFDGCLRIFDELSGARKVLLRGSARNQGWAAACSPDGRWIAAGNGDGTVRIWDTSIPSLSDEVRPTFELPVFAEAGERRKAVGWPRYLQWESTGLQDGEFTLWFASDTGVWSYTIQSDSTAVTGVHFPIEPSAWEGLSLTCSPSLPPVVAFDRTDKEGVVYDTHRRRCWIIRGDDRLNVHRALILPGHRLLLPRGKGLVSIIDLTP
ncbi:unnamed protein product [Jaminaea pallidilutea]